MITSRTLEFLLHDIHITCIAADLSHWSAFLRHENNH